MPQPVEVNVTLCIWLQGDEDNVKPPNQQMLEEKVLDYLTESWIDGDFELDGRMVIAIEMRKDRHDGCP